MRRKNHKTGFDHLLGSNNPLLQQIMSKIYQLDALDQMVMPVLDEQFRPHCRVCNLRDGILVIGVESPAWMTPLRFQCPDILQKLRKIPALAGVIKIELKVQPPMVEPPEPAAKTMPALSADIAHYYQSLAEQTDEPALKAVLKRISEHS